MTASEGECIGPAPVDVELLQDLEALSNQQLRVKYKLEANSHRSMRQRSKDGRSIDPAWADFRCFLRAMGRKPTPSHSIDCLDPINPHYGPGSCRWATPEEQTRNRTNTVKVLWQGEELTLADFAGKMGKPYHWVHYRYSKGLSPQKIADAAAATGTAFIPSRLNNDPEKISSWRQSFAEWQPRVRKSRKKLATTEVFEMLEMSTFYRVAEAWLRSQGYFELAPEDTARADELMNTKFGIAYRIGEGAVREAARALIRRDIEVAKKIIGQPPLRFWDMSHIEKWLIGKDDD